MNIEERQQQSAKWRRKHLNKCINDTPTFSEWLEKYFEFPTYEKVYKVKDKQEWHTKNQLLKKYQKAYKL